MSKLSQIEKALQAIDPTGFHRLCDSYLYEQGYEGINAIGLVIGADKSRRGTPDTLIAQSDGTYIFAEYSTQQEGLSVKFEGDLAKCFDPEETGIPVDRIREVVLCHNSGLSSEEEHRLREICRCHGVIPSIFGPHRIAHDLYRKYSYLAKDFLGVEVDTGQILPVTQFVVAYGRGPLTTPLDTTFRFREDELNQIIVALDSEQVVIISGRPGVGKSKLALEACQQYAALHVGTKFLCVLNRGPSLFEDLQVHFGAPGNYLIFVDDANRVNRFEYVLQLLHEDREERSIRIVSTVRDYAMKEVRNSARQFGATSLIALDPFTDDQIKKIAQEDFGIANRHYLDRIAQIAKGNPRLAIMAARVAIRENTLYSIADVSALYEEYFASISRELKELSDPSIVQVAGLIAFFSALDRSNKELLEAIVEAFRIDVQTFWACARRLHELEVVDMYEDEVVRISDQVLSTYLFYVSAFKEQQLDFGVLLDRFLGRFRHRLIDALNGVLSAFDPDAIRNSLRPHVDQAWSLAQQREDDESLRYLIDIFWFVKPTESLLYLRDKVESLEHEHRAISDLVFAPTSNVTPPASVLSLLDHFRGADTESCRIALHLLIDYLERRPSELPFVIRMLTEHWGINHRSHLYRFQREQQMIDVLIERSNQGRSELASRLFLTVAESLLRTHFHTNEMRDNRTVTVIQFEVPVTDDLIHLRTTIWKNVFVLFSISLLQEAVLDLIWKHSQSAYYVREERVIASDADQVLSFLASALSPSSFRHCLIVRQYLRLIRKRGVAAPEDLELRFTNKTYALSRLLLIDGDERSELGWETHNRVRKARLIAQTANFNSQDFEDFLRDCTEIIESLGHSSAGHFQVQGGISDVLLALAERDPDLYEMVFDRYLHSGSSLLGPAVLVNRLIEVRGADRAYEIISTGDYSGRTSWLLYYFNGVSSEEMTYERLGQLYSVYETVTSRDFVPSLGYLLRLPIDKRARAVTTVIGILLDKIQSDPE